MGHARLSIIDLETGNQPIANEDESVHIVVNGEFYDHDRIRRELRAAGHRLRTASDSEIALHLYEDLGASFLQLLRGEFAFALWDDSNQVLLAARDRFGIKPLFYAQVGDTIYVASEIKALFAAGVAARWDHAAVHRRLIMTNLCDETLFQGVRQVPPGHYLLADRSGIRLVRYWDFDYPRDDEPGLKLDFPAQVERVRELLFESVRLRLRADVPVGCYLSGGIDSCSVLGIASRLSAKPLAAFTISFEQENLDEAVVAREMAEQAGATFHCFRVNGDVRADYLVDAVVQNENLILTNGVAKYVLSKRVRDLGYKVVMTGEGSDEIFGGYHEFHVDKLARGGPSGAAGATRAHAAVAPFQEDPQTNWLRACMDAGMVEARPQDTGDFGRRISRYHRQRGRAPGIPRLDRHRRPTRRQTAPTPVDVPLDKAGVPVGHARPARRSVGDGPLHRRALADVGHRIG
jgi:asparagine synthase (glutamine-hydrolysing)